MRFAFSLRANLIGALAVAAFVPNVQADIVHHLINSPLPTWNLGPNHRLAAVDVDLNGDGVVDADFHYDGAVEGGTTPGCSRPCIPIVIHEMLHVADILISEAALDPVFPIDPGSFDEGYLFATGVALGVAPPNNLVERGPFGDFLPTPFDGVPRHGTSLIGFSFVDGFGWMRIRSSLHGPSGRYPNGFTQFRLIDVAYQTDWAGTIYPGQVPAPAAAPLFAVVAMATARRR